MAVQVFRLIQCFAGEFDPGMSLEFFVRFSDADAQSRADSLLAQQEPEREGFLETSKFQRGVAHGGVHHAAGFPSLLLHRELRKRRRDV